jgi:hypothetical protein
MKEKALLIELTPEQKEKLQKLTGKRVPRVKLNLEELEARAAPRTASN